MKCDACGTESDFDAAFIKNRKFQFGPKTLCPACWVRRSEKRQTRFFLWLLVAGVTGYALEQIDPDTLIGHFLLNFFFIGLFLVLSIVPHELGHVIAGRLLGWRVYQVVIGLGKPLFKWRWFGILFDVRAIPIAGATWMAPKDTRWFRTKRCLSILAGPAVNAAMLVAVVLLCQGSLSNLDFDALPTWARMFVWANGFILVVNLWPYQTKTGFALPTDGKQILQTFGFTKKALQQVQAMQFSFEAMLCRDQSDLAGARAWCDKGLALFPEDPHLLNLSGITSLAEGSYEKAREVFLKLLAKEGQPPFMRFIILNNLAYADVLSENAALLAEADAYSKDAFIGVPWISSVVGTRGTVLVALGQHEEGMKLLAKSMADTDNPRSKAENCCRMALALATTGKMDEARKYLQLARQLDPKCCLLDRTERKLGPLILPRASRQ